MFDSASFNTGSISPLSFEFGEVVQQILSIGGPDADDEKPRIDDNQILMMVIKSFLSKQ